MNVFKMYWVPKNETEAHIIVNLLGMKFKSDWHQLSFKTAVGEAIKVRSPGNIVYGNDTGDRTESTIEELLEMALNSFEEKPWKPEVDESYIYPNISNPDYPTQTRWTGVSKLDDFRLKNGLVFRPEQVQEAVDAALKMLNSLKEKE